MKTNRILGLAGAVLMAAASAAQAQHAGFVLFGEPSEAGRVQATERKFVHPVTSPYFHEDSFITTDLRAWALYHDFPNDDLIDGGSAKVYAVQARLALTSQLQLVAYKDGYTDFDAGILKDSGWNDVAAGLKWNFLQDWGNQLHAAVGVGYELPVGSPSVLQNDRELRFWASVNKGFGKLHLGATVNYFNSLGNEDEAPFGNSDHMSWHLHADYWVCDWFSPVIEANGYHVLDRGEESVPFSGIDVTNLGGGGDVISAAVGAEFRPMDKLAVRAAYELPVTSDEDDLYGWRVTLSVVYSF
jgi:hypothetical protein